jgi:hypothetical protein
VLNAIAQAGGTGQAYSATNQASLTATIEAIAGQVAGCCRDACTGSEAKCGPNGDVLHCATDAEIGCNTWVSSNCLPESVCSNGSCIACQNSCAVGKVYCGNGKVQTCVAGPNGCNVLQNARDCGWGELCDSGSCTTPCTDECTEGAGKCGGGIPSQCVRGASSCTKWQAEPACPASQPCVQGGCRSACSGGEIETCAVGYVCTHVAEGAVCVPRPSPSPSPDAGQGLDPGSSQPPKPSPSKTGGSSTSEVGGAGCGCGAGGAASLAALWPLLLLAWRRKQR